MRDNLFILRLYCRLFLIIQDAKDTTSSDDVTATPSEKFTNVESGSKPSNKDLPKNEIAESDITQGVASTLSTNPTGIIVEKDKEEEEEDKNTSQKKRKTDQPEEDSEKVHANKKAKTSN